MRSMRSLMRRTLGLVGISVLLSGSVLAAAQKVTAIVGATLVHPEKAGAPTESDVTVIIAGDRIQSVGPSQTTRVPKGAKTINAHGKWILPGLVDSHVHFHQSANPFTRPDAFDATKIVSFAEETKRNHARLPITFKVWLASGVTSVADVGGPFWNFEVRDKARKSAAAPRVAIAGPLLSMVDRPQLDLGDPPIIKVATPEAARELAKKELAHKPDYLKVWYIHRPGDDLAAQEAIVKAAGETAHAAGARLAVHATELEVAKSALRAGADILVHSVQDKPVDSEFLQLAKARNIIYIPTLFVRDGYNLVMRGEWKPTDAERRLGDPQILAHMNDLDKLSDDRLPERIKTVRSKPRPDKDPEHAKMENLRPVWDAGITVAMGTDAGNVGTLHGPSIFREMQLMRDAGLTMPEILRSATVNGAKMMGMEKDLGSIEVGRLADIVILDADPLGGVENLSKIYRTIKGGVVFDSPVNQKDLKQLTSAPKSRTNAPL